MPFDWKDELLLREAAAAGDRAAAGVQNCVASRRSGLPPLALGDPNSLPALYDMLAASYVRLEEECAGAYRSARRNRAAFQRATILAAVMGLAATAGWLTVWLRG